MDELDVRVISQHDKRAVLAQELTQRRHRFLDLNVSESAPGIGPMQVLGQWSVVQKQEVDSMSVHPFVPDVDVQLTDHLPIRREVLISRVF